MLTEPIYVTPVQSGLFFLAKDRIRMVSNGKRKMNLGFDIDGVIADFSQALLETIKKNYGLALKKTDIYCFDLNIVLGITKSEGKQLIIEVLKKDLPLNFGAKETLETTKPRRP